MNEQETLSTSQCPPTSQSERLRLIAEKFLQAMETTGTVPPMFRAIFPALKPLALSSLDKLTDEQAADLVKTARGYLDYIETGGTL